MQKIASNKRWHGYHVIVLFVAILGLLFYGLTAVSAQNTPSPHISTAPNSEPSAVYLNQWGSSGTGTGQFSQPYAVDTDADGNIFVADRGNDRIQKFDADGNFITQWGSSGSGFGQFSLIADIAVGPYGHVYVTDIGNDRITLFENDGSHVVAWIGGNNILFNNPRGIDVDHWGNVFVADNGNDRVVKFDFGGGYITQWGTTGSGNGQFNSPAGVAVDSTGRVFVSDLTNDNVQAFDNNGIYKDKWGSSGTGDGLFTAVMGLAVDHGDNVYTTDIVNDEVQKFTNAGVHLARWGATGSGNGQLDTPSGLAIEKNGNILIADTNNHRIQRFRPSGIRRCHVALGQVYEYSHVQAEITDIGRDYLSEWTPDSGFAYATGIATDSEDNVFIIVRPALGTFFQVQKFDLAGNFITSWGAPGNNVGSFSFPEGIDVDGRGNVYVADTLKNRIRKYDNDGNFITTWGDDTIFQRPSDIATNATDEVYIVDRSNNRIRHMSNNGVHINMWGSFGSGDGQFMAPQGIAVGPDGSVYVTDKNNDRVQKFDADGNFITKWGSFGTGPGQFDTPYGITVDNEGSVFVTDRFNERIQQFDSDGNFLTEWGVDGSGDGEFNNPLDIAHGTGSRLYVADAGNGRVQWFTGTNCLSVTWYNQDNPLANDSTMTGQYWEIDKGGTVKANLTLPQNNYANPHVCRRYLLSWRCGQDSFSSSTVTQNGLTLFNRNDWTVGDCMVLTTPNIVSSVYNLNTGEVTLNWTGNAERYFVRQTTNPMGTGGSRTMVIGSSTYTHNTGGINYFYVIEGYDTDCSIYSEPAQTTGTFSFDIVPGS